MKYLKPIFEKYKSTLTEEEANELEKDVNSFVSDRLAYLLDEGFEVTTIVVYDSNNNGHYSVRVAITQQSKVINPFSFSTNKFYNWFEVKDYFITFFNELVQTFEIDRPEKNSKVPSIKKSDIQIITDRYMLRLNIKDLMNDFDNSLENIKIEGIRFEICDYKGGENGKIIS